MNDKLFRTLHFLKHQIVASRNGHGIHSPFAYKLYEEVFYCSNDFYDFAKLDRLRTSLLNDGRILEVEDLGAGSQKFSSDKRMVAEIARWGISSRKQSELIYRL